MEEPRIESGGEIGASVADTLDFLAPRPNADGTWTGRALGEEGRFLFGGFVLAQSVAAATRTAPPGTRLHSLHGYFLRPASATAESQFQVQPVRDGRAFATRRVQMLQGEKALFDMTCSFSADGAGAQYDLPVDVPLPAAADVCPGPGPWECVWLDPTPARPDGTRESTHRHWCRVAASLPDDPHLHTALLAYVSDWTGTGGRPLRLDGDTQGMVSLDHAVWFHRAARADEWLLFDVHSLVNAGGRGLLRGVIRGADGRIVASVAQEMLLAEP